MALAGLGCAKTPEMFSVVEWLFLMRVFPNSCVLLRPIDAARPRKSFSATLEKLRFYTWGNSGSGHTRGLRISSLNDVAVDTFAKGWKGEIGVRRGGLSPLSRGRPSEYPRDDFVASGLETAAMTEQDALGLPRVDCCERRLCLPPLQQ